MKFHHCFFLLVLVSGCERRDSIEFPFGNSELSWSGQWLGISLEHNDKIASYAVNMSADERRAAYEALDDIDKYVAAHVVLTINMFRKITVDGTEWNHLDVNIKGGVPEIKDQRKEIKAYWKRILSAQKKIL